MPPRLPPPSPPSLLSRYHAWVRAHASSLTALEGAASAATWLLPERFGGDELGAEAVHSALGLASIYHEAVLGGAVGGGGGGRGVTAPVVGRGRRRGRCGWRPCSRCEAGGAGEGVG